MICFVNQFRDWDILILYSHFNDIANRLRVEINHLEYKTFIEKLSIFQ